MSKPRPIADEAVQRSPALSWLALAALLASLGAALAGARSLSGVLRGLDQKLPAGAAQEVEAPAARPVVVPADPGR